MLVLWIRLNATLTTLLTSQLLVVRLGISANVLSLSFTCMIAATRLNSVANPVSIVGRCIGVIYFWTSEQPRTGSVPAMRLYPMAKEEPGGIPKQREPGLPLAPKIALPEDE